MNINKFIDHIPQTRETSDSEPAVEP